VNFEEKKRRACVGLTVVLGGIRKGGGASLGLSGDAPRDVCVWPEICSSNTRSSLRKMLVPDGCSKMSIISFRVTHLASSQKEQGEEK